MAIANPGASSLLILSIFGWVGSWAYAWVFLPHYLGTCTQGSPDGWTASLIFYLPLSWVFVAVALLGRRWSRRLRWLALPHPATMAFGLSVIWPYFWGTTVKDEHVCQVRDGPGFSDLSADLMQRAWAPIQLLSLVLLALVLISFWRSGRSPGARAAA